MAAELAVPHTERRAAVIGCGIVGLTSARQLQRLGFDVTIYAMAVPPNTTSNMSGATFEAGALTSPSEQTRRAAEIAYREVQLLVGSHYGVRWIHAYVTNDAPAALARPSQPGYSPNYPVGRVELGPGEHPFGTKYASQFSQIVFEPSIYLDALMRDVLRFGGRILTRTFDTPGDLMALTERVIVNCTGLGAKPLFGDQELNPVKGQLHVLVPQPEVTYRTGGMWPRSDGIVLGGTDEAGVWSLDVNEAAQKRIINDHAARFNAMRAPIVGVPITGLGTTIPCTR